MKLLIDINDEMKLAATKESRRREKFIKHHFEVGHLFGEERNIVGFLGEFASCQFLGLDWKNGIRENYLTIDDFDIIYNGKRIDDKTKTIPDKFFFKILYRLIQDDEMYGSRLINKGQISLLDKYDIIIFGVMVREDTCKWYPFGWLETKFVLDNYKPTNQRPDGGCYLFAGLPEHSSLLKPIIDLKNE
jgi:hypothetical protein